MTIAPKLGEKIGPRTIGPFAAADLRAYAEVSGDDNPLHLDAGFAARLGLKAPPVHGMKILAAFEPLLRAWRPELCVIELAGQFLTPALEGEILTLSARVAKLELSSIIVLRLSAQTASGAPALIGEARLRVAEN
jgi:3-hydroxybutyryl-CoA dehydratase